jgi:hypothetical protein
VKYPEFDVMFAQLPMRPGWQSGEMAIKPIPTIEILEKLFDDLEKSWRERACLIPCREVKGPIQPYPQLANLRQFASCRQWFRGAEQRPPHLVSRDNRGATLLASNF